VSKERPILFSGPMVRAILEGRKTQTRRVIRNAAGAFWDHGAYKPLVGGDGIVGWQDQGYRIYTKGNGAPCPQCPYGKIGDLLWVRERMALRGSDYSSMLWCYDADGTPLQNQVIAKRYRNRSHMHRWASRITLEIVNVRVERLQGISEEDANAEGAEHPGCAVWVDRKTEKSITGYRLGFLGIWESINGPGSWDANPWVWAITFCKNEVGK
jgi:hypothetical protein